jgi:hypothetical protein
MGWGGGGSRVRKIYCTGLWKLATIQLYNLLKSPVGAHIHTIYGPLIAMALFVMLLMRKNPFLGQVGGGCFQGPTPSHLPS